MDKQQKKYLIIAGSVATFLLVVVLALTFRPEAEPELPSPNNWLDGRVSFKGGHLTHPVQAYTYARALRLPFVDSPREREELVSQGHLVALQSGATYELMDVSDPFVLPVTKQFVERLASQYQQAGCGRLVITSALRLKSRRLRNGSEHSVHPTGMAVDFRIPQGECRTWLQDTLGSIEASRRIDVTRERHPPHFHVVVVTGEYAAWLRRQ